MAQPAGEYPSGKAKRCASEGLWSSVMERGGRAPEWWWLNTVLNFDCLGTNSDSTAHCSCVPGHSGVKLVLLPLDLRENEQIQVKCFGQILVPGTHSDC